MNYLRLILLISTIIVGGQDYAFSSIKQGEFRGTPRYLDYPITAFIQSQVQYKENPEPSLGGNALEGATTRGRGYGASYASNAPTSALHCGYSDDIVYAAWKHAEAGGKLARDNNTDDPIDLTPVDTTTSLLEDLREVAGSIVISRREERQNSGKAQIISLITSKIENLDRSFGQKLNEFLLAPTGTGLTAGNGGKDLLPLTEIISIAGTGTVHGINSATNTWWKNQTRASSATGRLAFKGELRSTYNDNTKHNDGAPNLVLTSQEVHEKYEESLEGQVRYGSTELANLGFETVMLRGAQVMWDEIVPRQSGAAYTLHDNNANDEHVAFFLNTDFLKLFVDSQTDLVNRPFMDSVDQTAKSALVLFMGQLICTNRRTQGVLTSIVPSGVVNA